MPDIGADGRPVPSREIAYYLSGAISANREGTMEENIAKMEAMAVDLRANGYKIVAPLEVGNAAMEEEGLTRQQTWDWYMRRDIQAMMDDHVQAIVMMPYHYYSKGAMIELKIAQLMGLQVWHTRQLLGAPGE